MFYPGQDPRGTGLNLPELTIPASSAPTAEGWQVYEIQPATAGQASSTR